MNPARGILFYIFALVIICLIFFPEIKFSKALYQIIDSISGFFQGIPISDEYGLIKLALICLTIVAIFKILSTKA